MANSKPVFGYWAIRGLAQPIRFLAAYLNVELDEKRYTSIEEWQGEKFSLGLAFPNLPYLIDGSIKLTESRAIIKHIARESGSSLYPKSSGESQICDMLENVIWDLWFSLLRYCNTGLDSMKDYFENEIPKKIECLNSFLEGKKYILGDQISYVDFILYEALFHYTTYQSTYLEKYPALLAFKTNFEGIPEVAKYIASGQYIKGPCINPRAKIAF